MARGLMMNIINKLLNEVKLPEESDKKNIIIYVVPRIFMELKPSSYTPYVVSIGPIHSQLSFSIDTLWLDIKDLKWEYLKSFLSSNPLKCRIFHTQGAREGIGDT